MGPGRSAGLSPDSPVAFERSGSGAGSFRCAERDGSIRGGVSLGSSVTPGSARAGKRGAADEEVPGSCTGR